MIFVKDSHQLKTWNSQVPSYSELCNYYILRTIILYQNFVSDKRYRIKLFILTLTELLLIEMYTVAAKFHKIWVPGKNIEITNGYYYLLKDILHHISDGKPYLQPWSLTWKIAFWTLKIMEHLRITHTLM